ncbi:hypothetical protein MMC19_005571 [Ptychographa xylographoides]|nr:hypothetical protein [Ptychographa xylographoides]
MADSNDTQQYLVWDDDGTSDVQSLFKNPSFVPAEHRSGAASYWYSNMAGFGLFLYDTPNQTNNVFQSGPAIYSKLAPGGNMPEAGPDYSGRFPADAIEQFRVWYNQGGRVKKTDPIPSPNVPAQPIEPQPARKFIVPAHPVWDAQGAEDDIKMCFTDPCWISNGSSNAADWQTNMLNFQYDATTDPPTMFDLQNYEHVKGWARSVYDHVASKAMPIEAPFFSDEAVEAFRLWYNQGCPQTQSQVGVSSVPKAPIPPEPVEKPFKMRKDINTLTDFELTTYRLQLLALHSNAVEGSTWQTGGFLHANWCLHYMQASFPWHRAHLLWLETQIGGPIPYWNFYSSKAADPDSPDSGIPQAFLDEQFKDFEGNWLDNPLRHALARNGMSRASTSSNPLSQVKRAQPFEQPDGPIKRADYITQYVPTYLDQIYHATVMLSIGDTEGAGYPFTFAQADLTPENLAKYYKDHLMEFDGALEQAHDNLHGWAGPDMANNSYAAFDPLFWSFHANFDRLFETWIRAHEQQDWTSNFPLRPFKGREGRIDVIEGDPFVYKYTNIGDMVMNCKALGYTYAPPNTPDYAPPSSKISHALAPIVFFPNVKCTVKTYVVHVALDNGDGKKLIVGQPGYIGSITRLGMGPDNGNDRCVENGVLRRLEAAKAVQDIGGMKPHSEVKLKLLVVEDGAGKPAREVSEAEYRDWPGFKPLIIWDEPVAGVVAH